MDLRINKGYPVNMGIPFFTLKGRKGWNQK